MTVRPLEEVRHMHPGPSGREVEDWPRRLDESIDNIAHMLGFTQVPYFASQNATASRYVAPYRLELLEQAIKEYVA